LFTSFPGANVNVERAYRKGLAITIKQKSYSKTASYGWFWPTRFAGIAGMDAGMRGHPRIASIYNPLALSGRGRGEGEDKSKSWCTIGKPWKSKDRHICRFGVHVGFCIAGVRPGGRATFVSAKVAKTRCAEHVQQLEGASPFDNLMEVKS
jgi:hypothetical protein